MNKSIGFLLGGVAIIGLVAVLVFAVMQRSSSDQATGSQDGAQISDSMEKEKNDGEVISSNFIELIRLGKNYTCTFSTTDDADNKTSGVVYLAEGGDKLNGDFTMTQANGTQMQSNIIRDGVYNYMWSSQMQQGIKTKIEPETDSIFPESEDAEESEATIFDEQAEVDFDCKPWNVDASKFVPPTDIEFVDYSAQIEAMQQQVRESTGAQCSACEQVPAGEARQQCLKALGC